MRHLNANSSRHAAAALAISLFAAIVLGLKPASAEALLAQGAPDCYAIGLQVAAEEGGMLAGATAESSGGTVVCRIVVLVPAKEGERPRRMEKTVPAS